MVYRTMDETLVRVGLPVKCGYSDCPATGFVKPKSVDPEHGGWYMSKMLRYKIKKRWFCPEHYEKGRSLDNKFYENLNTPHPYTEDEVDDVEEELYNLLD